MAIEFVENNTTPRVEEKETFVVLTTEHCINKHVSDPRLNELLLTIVDLFVSDVVKLVVDASKGKLNLNQSKLKRYFICCNKK